MAGATGLFIAACTCSSESAVSTPDSSHSPIADANNSDSAQQSPPEGGSATGGGSSVEDAQNDQHAKPEGGRTQDASRLPMDGGICTPSTGCTQQDGGLSFFVSQTDCFSRPAIDCSLATAVADTERDISQTCAAITDQSCLNRISASFDADGCVTYVDPELNDTDSAYFACVVGKIIAERWPCAAGTLATFQCEFN